MAHTKVRKQISRVSRLYSRPLRALAPGQAAHLRAELVVVEAHGPVRGAHDHKGLVHEQHLPGRLGEGGLGGVSTAFYRLKHVLSSVWHNPETIGRQAISHCRRH